MKKIFYSSLIVICFVILGSISNVKNVYSDKGDLKINNQVIYQNGEGSQNNMTTFAIHELFLPETNMKQNEIKEESRLLIRKAKKMAFTKEEIQETSISEQVTTSLFSKDYTMAEEKRTEDSEDKSSYNIGFIILVVVGSILTIGIGIFLGKTYPNFLKKNER